MRRERKYALDANLYIRAFRDPAANAALQLFHTAFAPFEYLNAVVVQELIAGARAADAPRLQRTIFEPFERLGRVVTPSYDTWKRAGEVLARLAAEEGLELRRITKSFANDVLLALSCREAGLTLVTENAADFARIRRVTPFEFVPPWPQPAS
ncbi:MAG: type II toxin-antitoxin system VapC family toxin [Gemmatimonadota bacterium]|nr:type II toxin-antitoxin system VapC family toxin [Gemmatimonadota bacterium]